MKITYIEAATYAEFLLIFQKMIAEGNPALNCSQVEWKPKTK